MERFPDILFRAESGALSALVSPATTGHTGERHDGDTHSIANEFQRQTGNDERCEKERQEPLSCAAEGDNLALGGVEGFSAARISAIADLQGMTSWRDWYLDRAIHFD